MANVTDLCATNDGFYLTGRLPKQARPQDTTGQ
jgi:hypothetical protein